MDINNTPDDIQVQENGTAHNPSRRRFFQLAGGIAGVGLVMASCRRTPPSDTYLGAGDVALLNYLYVLKQVTVAFYTQAVATPYYGITQSEVELQTDIRDQEVAHREFLKKLLGSDAVKTIVTQLAVVTFADKTSFLTHAATLEDLSASSYAGIIRLLQDQSYIVPLSQMSSVDARHAGYVHDILNHNSFASGMYVIDSTGLNWMTSPSIGMSTLGTYLETRFDTSKLPTF
jgi:hypothetical protein